MEEFFRESQKESGSKELGPPNRLKEMNKEIFVISEFMNNQQKKAENRKNYWAKKILNASEEMDHEQYFRTVLSLVNKVPSERLRDCCNDFQSSIQFYVYGAEPIWYQIPTIHSGKPKEEEEEVIM